MMIFKKAIPRRTFLRGFGTALALPLLEGMVPAFSATRALAAKSPTRLSFVYVPNGIIMDKWTPTAEGSAFELPLTLEPLAAFRDHFLVLTGLNHDTADPLPGEGEVAPHDRASASYLTGVHAKREGQAGTSVDQIAAQEFGKHTQLASLELGLDANDVIGQCERNWNCAFRHTLSWRTPTTPLPIENQPRAIFERLFGDSSSTDPVERRARIRRDASILDSITQAATYLMTELGPRDRSKVTEYLDAIRDIERRIQAAEEQASRELPIVDRPPGAPARFDDYAKLMFDLQVLAFQCDMTRVITFMMGREQSDRTYREIGIPDAHHPLSHHQNDPDKIAKVTQINLFHAKIFAYYLEKLKSTPDGDGSLFDHSMILYGSGISDGNQHLHQNLPALLAGGASGRLKGGRHLRYSNDTPMSNLFLTMLDKLDIPVENFGDSTGKLELLSVA
ncbi:MAG: DUF1552 domain-containing protein [Acidobacteria bacterium]|nr:DUF1552 domain-containing protein [Acidobacteriota bacterium]